MAARVWTAFAGQGGSMPGSPALLRIVTVLTWCAVLSAVPGGRTSAAASDHLDADGVSCATPDADADLWWDAPRTEEPERRTTFGDCRCADGDDRDPKAGAGYCCWVVVYKCCREVKGDAATSASLYYKLDDMKPDPYAGEGPGADGEGVPQ